jgi:two-component system, LytTR family, sensor kinase
VWDRLRPGRNRTGARGRRLLGWTALAVAAWTVESVTYAVAYVDVALRSGHPVPFGLTLRQTWVSSMGWVPITLMCLWLASRWPITTRPVHVLVHLLGLVVAVLVRTVVAITLNGLVDWYPQGLPPIGALTEQILVNNLLYFVLLDGLAHAIVLARAARARERQFARARMDALIAQIQPHFLFNSLNTIAAVVHTDPDQAEATIVDLAALLRYSLDRDSAELVPLQDEVDAATAYLRIEQRRFPDKLTSLVEVAPEVRHAGVPAFILQPLLENAVHHGLARHRRVGRLQLSAAAVADRVVIRVEDDGVGYNPAAPAGVGLSNVAERIRQHFGGKASLVVRGREGGGTVVALTFPSLPAGASSVPH